MARNRNAEVGVVAARLAPTITAGAVVGIVEVVFASSFAALLFGGRLADRIADGVGLNVGAAALILLVIAVRSGRQGVIGSTQDATAAVLAVVAGGIVARVADPATAFLSVVAMIAASSVLSGVVQIALGALKLGNLVRFMPYPVVGGFLAGTGWLLAKGSLEVMTGIAPTLDAASELLDGDAIVKIVPGVTLGIGLVASTRLVPRPLTIPVVLAASVALFYAAVLGSGSSIASVESDGWLLGPLPDVGLWQPWVPRAITGADWSAVAAEAGGIATVVLVGALAFLLNASGIELALRRDLDLNRELRSAGSATAVVGLAGGIPGFHALSLTTLVRRLDADARWSAVVASAICVLALVAGASLLALVPRVVLGGLLLFLGLEFLIEWLWDARRTMPRSERAIPWAIAGAIALWGLLPGVALGLVLAVVLFAVSYSRTDVVRQSFTAATFRSNVERPVEERRLLRAVGSQAQIMKLQGFVFFGTASSLLERIRRRAMDPETPLRFMILDFRRVTGLDSSAVLSFSKVAQLASVASFEVILVSVPVEIRAQLDAGGVGDDGGPISYEIDLDRGVEIAEDALLRGAGGLAHGRAGGIDLSDDIRERLGRHLEPMQLEAGAVLLRQGDPSDALYVLDEGTLTVQLETATGEVVRLRQLGAGTVVGEIAMYLGTPRTATVTADGPCRLRRLSRDALERMERDDPELATSLHRAFVRLMAERLSETIATLETLVD
ncbi:MAG TPA: SulP family inorganic anion transporter [Actinomycetota bacterium]|nr:SulP family inorganic anion transporter [Actinomycetota bacterium]